MENPTLQTRAMAGSSAVANALVEAEFTTSRHMVLTPQLTNMPGTTALCTGNPKNDHPEQLQAHSLLMSHSFSR
jgi:hypothetical protein